MLIVWMAWVYVVLLLAVAQDAVVQGGMVFVFLGLLPSGLLFYRVRHRQRLRAQGLLEPQKPRRRPPES